MHSFFRIFKFAFQDIGRNIGLSFMTIFILILMLLSVNTLWSMNTVTKEAVRLVKDQVNVSLYLSADASDKDVQTLSTYIRSMPEVTNIDVQSRDQVLKDFQKRHQLEQPVLDSLNELGGNPFGPTLIVKTREPEEYQKIIDAISVPEYASLIDNKSFEGHENVLTNIQRITDRVQRISLGMSALFAIISFLIIFNTIRVAIHTQRIEISIKRLVGANNWFIRGPYLVESFLFSIVSVIITAVVVRFALAWLDTYLGVVFPNNFSLTAYYNAHAVLIYGVQIFAVLLLTTVSSTLAMRRQLKV